VKKAFTVNGFLYIMTFIECFPFGDTSIILSLLFIKYRER